MDSTGDLFLYLEICFDTIQGAKIDESFVNTFRISRMENEENAI